MYWLRVYIHPTWHFTAACLGVVIGVTVAQWVPFSHSGLLFIAGLLLLLSFARPRRAMVLAALVAGFSIGMFRGSLVQHDMAAIASLQGERVSIEGAVASDPVDGARGMTLKLRDVVVGERHIPGEVWVSGTERFAAIQRSDRLALEGTLTPGFGTFVASMRNPTVATITREQGSDPALTVRNEAAAAIRSAISEPAASLGIGYVLGQKSALPRDLEESLVTVGLTHIVVASGYNLMVLVRLARRTLAPLSKYLAVFASGLLVVGFIMLAGASPSMVRAGMVAGLGLWAWYYGRHFHPFTLIALVGMMTVMVNPHYAWGDLGWQLSFAAFIGVMMVAPLLRAYFFGDVGKGQAGQLLVEAVAAQLMTAPIIMMAFGQFSTIAVIGNLLIVPFVPLAMLLVALTGAGAWLLPSLGAIVGWPAEVLLVAMITVIRQLSELEWAQMQVAMNGWGVLLWYLAVLLACGYMKFKTGYQLRHASVVE